jgi:hypothetical protein
VPPLPQPATAFRDAGTLPLQRLDVRSPYIVCQTFRPALHGVAGPLTGPRPRCHPCTAAAAAQFTCQSRATPPCHRIIHSLRRDSQASASFSSGSTMAQGGCDCLGCCPPSFTYKPQQQVQQHTATPSGVAEEIIRVRASPIQALPSSARCWWGCWPFWESRFVPRGSRCG